MDLNEYYLLLIVLMGLMLITNKMFEYNVYIHGFWLLTILWYGVIAMNQNSSNIVFGLICVSFNVLLNIFYIDWNLRKRGN